MGRKTASDRYQPQEPETKTSSYKNTGDLNIIPEVKMAEGAPDPDISLSINQPTTTVDDPAGVKSSTAADSLLDNPLPGVNTGNINQSAQTGRKGPPTAGAVQYDDDGVPDKGKTKDEYKQDQESKDLAEQLLNESQVPTPDAGFDATAQYGQLPEDAALKAGVGGNIEGIGPTGSVMANAKDSEGNPIFGPNTSGVYYALTEDKDPDSPTFGENVYQNVWQFKGKNPHQFAVDYESAPMDTTFKYAMFGTSASSVKDVFYKDLTKEDALKYAAGGVKITPVKSGNALNWGEQMSLWQGKTYFSEVQTLKNDPFKPKDKPGVTYMKISNYDISEQQKKKEMEGFGIDKDTFLDNDNKSMAKDPFESNVQNVSWNQNAQWGKLTKVGDGDDVGTMIPTIDNMVYIPSKGKYYPMKNPKTGKTPPEVKKYLKEKELYEKKNPQGGPMYFGFSGTEQSVKDQHEAVIDILGNQRTQKQEKFNTKMIQAFITGKDMGTGLGSTKALTWQETEKFYKKLAETKRGESFSIGGKDFTSGGFLGTNMEKKMREQYDKYSNAFPSQKKPNNKQSSSGSIYGPNDAFNYTQW